MPAAHLTRLEAEERAAHRRAHPAYEVDLDLTGDGDTFRSDDGRCDSARPPERPTFIESTTREVHELVLNGRALDAAGGERRRPHPPRRPRGRERAARRVRRARTRTPARACTASSTPSTTAVYLYTEFAVAEANRVYAVFDQPDLKASVRFTITAPADWQVLSNAPTPEPVPDAAGGTTATWAFETGPVISSYIVAIIAGPYAAWHGTARSVDGRDVPLGLFTRASLAQYAEPEVMFGTVQAGPRRSTSRRSACPTRTASTTRSSCPSTTGAPWRTSAPSRSTRATCSAPGSPTRGASSARSWCCTSSATCGSATR